MIAITLLMLTALAVVRAAPSDAVGTASVTATRAPPGSPPAIPPDPKEVNKPRTRITFAKYTSASSLGEPPAEAWDRWGQDSQNSQAFGFNSTYKREVFDMIVYKEGVEWSVNVDGTWNETVAPKPEPEATFTCVLNGPDGGLESNIPRPFKIDHKPPYVSPPEISGVTAACTPRTSER